MGDAGLETRLDAVGNLFGRWAGTERRARACSPARTSTRRSTPGATTASWACSARSTRCGRCARTASRRGARSRSSRGRGRSRASAPAASAAARRPARSRAPTSTRSSTATGSAWPPRCSGAGFDPDRVADAAIDPAGVHALVELHIEQGIVLEDAGEPLGVVTAIAAPHDFRLTFRGAATHAGATPMHLRRDALAGAAEAMVALERITRESPSGTTVGTVGVVRALPGAINVVPGDRRARRRRARHRFRVARTGRRGHRGGGARDRGPAPPGARPDPDRGGRPRGLRPPRRRGGRRRGRRARPAATAA